jgi:flagellar biosynthesis regulator FlaF
MSVKSVTRYASCFLFVQICYADMLSLSLISAKERPRPRAVSRSKPVLEASDDDDAMSIKSVARYVFIGFIVDCSYD